MEFVAILICLILSGFFSGAEIAFFSITESRLQAMAEKGRRASQRALSLRRNPQRLLATILIGNNVVNLTAAALVSIVSLHYLGSKGVAIGTGLLTMIVLLFGEIVPKTLCAKHADSAVQILAHPIYWVERLFSPMLYLLEPLILKLTGGRGLAVPFVTEEELKVMLKAGVLKTDEGKMIKNVFEFSGVTAEDVMTPRIDMFGLAGRLSLWEAKEELFQSKYSRIPVYDGTLENVTGILYRNQALRDLAQGKHDSTLQALARPPFFIPGTKRAGDLLKQFQEQKRHIAIVVNEFGGVLGLVTTEDLLEEVVGEILDETDVTEELIKRIGKNKILVNGRTEVRKINEFLKVELNEEDQNTISGLMQQKLGHIPAVGEDLRVDGCLLTVRDADEKSIKSIQIHKAEETSSQKTEPSSVTPSE